MIVAAVFSVPHYTIHSHQPAHRLSSKVKPPCYIPMAASELTDRRNLKTRHAMHRPSASTCPILPDYGLLVHLQTHWSTVHKCISIFAQLLPSWLHDHSHLVRSQTR
jgi:hypothetical protein